IFSEYQHGNQMRFYDIISFSPPDQSLFEELGFSKVFAIEKSRGAPPYSDAEFAYASSGKAALQLLKSGAKALIADTLELGHDIPQYLALDSVPAIIPLYGILISSGFELAKSIRRTSRFYDQMRKLGVQCVFASMAPNSNYLLSSMQLNALSLMLGKGRSNAASSNSIIPDIFGASHD
ncbi:MAG: hypothetical protein QXN59_03265, partial [Candidatus Micrarchaeaceae archaeon]